MSESLSCRDLVVSACIARNENVNVNVLMYKFRVFRLRLILEVRFERRGDEEVEGEHVCMRP